MLLFISSGEIFIILLFVLIFFGADKIPEFTKIMGKGVREFRKATDDIKREFQESSSGVIDEIRAISDDVTDKLKKEIERPVEESINETVKTFDDFEGQYKDDMYHEHNDRYGNEYEMERQSALEEKE